MRGPGETAAATGGAAGGGHDAGGMAMSAHEAMAASGLEATEEDRKAQEELERFRLEVELEAAIQGRSTREHQLQEAGGIRGVSMQVKVPAANGGLKKVKLGIVDALNQVFGDVINRLKQEQSSARLDPALVEAVLYLIPIYYHVNQLIHFHFEKHTYARLQGFIDLFIRQKTGLQEVMDRWLEKDLDERVTKPNKFLEPVFGLLHDMVGILKRLEHLMKPKYCMSAVEHLAKLVLPVRSAPPQHLDQALQSPPASEDHHKVGAWLYQWEPMLKITEQTGTRMLVELREAFSKAEFQKEYNRLRKAARPGEATHVEHALAVQKKILPEFGFEGSLKGVQEMRNQIHLLASMDPCLKKAQLDIHRLLQSGEPLPKMPIVQPATLERFDPRDEKQWKAHLATEGFVILAGIAAPSEVQAAYDLLWKFIESSDPKGQISRSDVDTWQDGLQKDEGWPAGRADGIIHSRGIGQSEVLWYLRCLPKLHKVFAALWQTEDLVVSFDGAGVFRPYGHSASWKTTKRNWYHVDQAHGKRGLHCIQGLITLKDASAETGGLVVVPQSHRFHGEICRTHKEPANGWNFLNVKPNDPILTTNDGPKMLEAKAGDLLLWDSRTVHCNTQPLVENKALLHGGDLIRAVAYICMTPAAWCSEDTLTQRLAAATKGVTTSHWPHEYHPMDIPRDKWKATLSEEQRWLVWPQKSLRSVGVALPGSMSILPEEVFAVSLEAPIRRTPTTVWDDPIGTLSAGQTVKGYDFGRWLRLSPGPWLSPEGAADEAWVSLESERRPGMAALRLVPT